jgi:hypothetical protein
MTSTFRTITSGVVEWRGLLVGVRFERQRWVDHLVIETIDPARAPLPVTETGFRSSFMNQGVIGDSSPDDFVLAWLDHAATDRRWPKRETAIRQYAMF